MRQKISNFIVYFYVVGSCEKEDYLQNLHVLSCVVQFKTFFLTSCVFLISLINFLKWKGKITDKTSLRIFFAFFAGTCSVTQLPPPTLMPVNVYMLLDFFSLPVVCVLQHVFLCLLQLRKMQEKLARMQAEIEGKRQPVQPNGNIKTHDV